MSWTKSRVVISLSQAWPCVQHLGSSQEMFVEGMEQSLEWWRLHDSSLLSLPTDISLQGAPSGSVIWPVPEMHMVVRGLGLVLRLGEVSFARPVRIPTLGPSCATLKHPCAYVGNMARATAPVGRSRCHGLSQQGSSPRSSSEQRQRARPGAHGPHGAFHAYPQ